MRRSTSLSVLTLALASLAFVACGDDDPAPAPGGGNTAGTGGSAAGTGGSAAGTGGSAAGTGGSSAGTGGSAAGTGGSEAGAGGTAAGGSDAGGAAGTAAAGSAGSAGAATVDPTADLAGCKFATATDGTAAATAKIDVGKTGSTYSPNCLKVKVGTVVTFDGNSASHPLRPFTKAGTLPNPVPSTSDATATATFTAKGAYGYFCQNHGGDGSTAGMVGAIYVVELEQAFHDGIDGAEASSIPFAFHRWLSARPSPDRPRPRCRFQRAGFPCTLPR